jgi:hypothetical protein
MLQTFLKFISSVSLTNDCCNLEDKKQRIKKTRIYLQKNYTNAKKAALIVSIQRRSLQLSSPRLSIKTGLHRLVDGNNTGPNSLTDFSRGIESKISFVTVEHCDSGQLANARSVRSSDIVERRTCASKLVFF